MTRSLPIRFAALGALALSTLLLPACISASDSGANLTGAGSGRAALFLEGATWGRLVDVFDSEGVLVETDVVVREGIQSDGVTFDLSLNPITQKETLTILSPEESSAFQVALEDAQRGLSSLQLKAFGDPPPFTKVARNGAIRLEFSELVDPATVDRQTIQLLVSTSNNTFRSLEVRYVVKEGVGADGEPAGIVIIDPTISKIDSENLDIPENGVGFPESFDQVDANIKILIPTEVNPFINQTLVLSNKEGTRDFDVKRNAAGDAIVEPHEFFGLDPVAVRAFRSGNEMDPFNGFVTDAERPSLIVSQDVTIAEVSATENLRTLTYSIDAIRCRGLAPKVGDVFETGDAIVQVTSIVDDSSPSAYVVQGTLIDGELPGGSFNVGGTLTTRYGSVDYALQMCFVTLTPEPQEIPAFGADPFATLSVRFSEPIDQSSVRSMDSMVLVSVDQDAPADDPARAWNFSGSGETVADYIDRQPGYDPDGGSGRIRFGPISVSGDAQTFTLAPVAGMTDAHGEGDDPNTGLFMNLALRSGPTGIRDLAGNQVEFTGFVAGDATQQETIELAGAASTWPVDRYFALRGNGSDENDDQLPEYAGSLGAPQGDGILRGRPLQRFSRAADPRNQYVGQRLRFTQGLMTPLTPAGAVLMTVYGYHHLGFGLSNPNEYDLDVEGLNWSPFDGVLFDDVFNRYSVALAHSNRFPDDFIDPNSGYPQYPNSGLKRLSGDNFDNNIFAFSDDPVKYAEFDEKIMFDRSYQISDVNKFVNSNGFFMYPWPEFNGTYTWRDTSMPPADGSSVIGGNNVSGQAQGAPPRVVSNSAVYQSGKIPSIGLPLLMRFRCYPRGEEFGFNGFQVQIMVGSSALPAFRIFSAGGRDGQGTWHLVRPDLPPEGTSPNGGYNTVTGATTKSFGPELYWGQVDFVVRVSRVHTHWFDFGGNLESLSNVTLEPTEEQQNPGTQLITEFRSSASIDVQNCGDSNILTDAQNMDAYANVDSDGCGTLSSPSEWVTDTADLVATGDRFFQLRFTFITNIDQGLEAEMDAFGLAYTVDTP